MTRPGIRACVALATAHLHLPAALGDEITATWVGGPSGSWSVPGNWSPPGAPNDNGSDTYHVVIDGEAEVTLPVAPVTIQTLTVAEGNVLTLVPPATLIIAGGLVHVDGSIRLNPDNGTPNARLIFGQSATIAGEGEVALLGQPGRCFLVLGNGVTVTLGVEAARGGGAASPPGPIVHGRGVIQGVGSMPPTLVNNRSIVADHVGDTLVVTVPNITNGGSLRASGGTLSVDNSAVSQGANGELANVGESFVGLTNTTVDGGWVTGGAFKAFPSAGVVTFTNCGLMRTHLSVEAGALVTLQGAAVQGTTIEGAPGGKRRLRDVGRP